MGSVLILALQILQTKIFLNNLACAAGILAILNYYIFLLIIFNVSSMTIYST